MPLRPNILERRLIRFSVMPGPMLDLALASVQAPALLAAAKLKLFQGVQKEPIDVEQLAHRVSASPR